jgi:hypothetical protein
VQKEIKSNISLHLVTQLWGESYIKLYADYVIQSLLCEGNLPALRTFKETVYEIHTTKQDRVTLEENINFQYAVNQLKDWISFHFVIIEGFIENPYQTMSDCHRKAIKSAESRNAAILFLQPDVIVGNGSLETVKEALLAGKRLVMAPGLRVLRQEMENKIKKCFSSDNRILFPSTRKLVAFATSHLHPISQGLVLDKNKKIHAYCSHLYWKMGQSSLYARCAHMHPLMVYPRNINCGFNHTIDWDYFHRACPDYNDWFIAQDSDQICLIELSELSKFADIENWQPATAKTISHFLNFASQPPHLNLFKKYYLFLGDNLTSSSWETNHKEANKLINKAIKKAKVTKIFPSAIIIRLKNWITLLRLNQNIKKNTFLYFLFICMYVSIRAIYKLHLFKRLNNEKNAVIILVKKIAKKMGLFEESLIASGIRRFKNKLIEKRNLVKNEKISQSIDCNNHAQALYLILYYCLILQHFNGQ